VRIARAAARPSALGATLLILLAVVAAGWRLGERQRTWEVNGVRLTRAFPLRSVERVFAYSRISPDGATLAYSSEMPDPALAGGVTRTIRLVDLASGTILLEEPGIDPYWSPGGDRFIYLSLVGEEPSVTVRRFPLGAVVREVASPELGDYFSWGVRDGRDVILTVKNNFYLLDSASRAGASGRVASCPRFGTGERPLISKDGRLVTSFIGGNVAVRRIDDCERVIDTGLPGQKADFSWDGRYIAFHAARPRGNGWAIQIVDLEQRTVRTLDGLAGSSLFPSWTRDGRLSFRYDGTEYRGFVTIENPLDIAAVPLPRTTVSLGTQWLDVFPGTSAPAAPVAVVTIWAPWSAHTIDAFTALRRARAFYGPAERVAILAGVDPGSERRDVDRMLAEYGEPAPPIALTREGLVRTSARNQMPTTLLFRNGTLVAQHLGAMSFEELRSWIAELLAE
jgi:hypothetical protein